MTIMTKPPEQNSEAVAGDVYENFEISQENTCVGVSFLQVTRVHSGQQRY